MLVHIAYLLFATLAALGCLCILFTKHELKALLLLVGIILCLSILYFLQGAPFIAITQLILQVGGILVLLICSLLFLKRNPSSPFKKWSYTKKILMSCLIVGLLSYIVQHAFSSFPHLVHEIPTQKATLGTTQTLGYYLLGPYGLLLELISVVLLVALVGILHMFIPAQSR